LALTYPLSLPTSIGISDIQLRASNAVAISTSPFSYKQQVVSYGGERWEASVTIPPVRKDLAAPWIAFLLSLKGQYGTFLLSDPDYTEPQGSITTGALTGSVGDSSVTVTMTGSLLAGDYIQLGSGSAARLHRVLVDLTGDGTLEIWPALRDTYTAETIVFDEPKGVFRLDSNVTAWDINNASAYGISFNAIEAIA